jgi:hypothetical protein
MIAQPSTGLKSTLASAGRDARLSKSRPSWNDGIAKPMFCEFSMMATLTPTTSPCLLTSGPPLLPGLSGDVVERRPASRPLITPSVSLSVCEPSGWPSATTDSPISTAFESPSLRRVVGGQALVVHVEHGEIDVEADAAHGGVEALLASRLHGDPELDGALDDVRVGDNERTVATVRHACAPTSSLDTDSTSMNQPVPTEVAASADLNGCSQSNATRCEMTLAHSAAVLAHNANAPVLVDQRQRLGRQVDHRGTQRALSERRSTTDQCDQQHDRRRFGRSTGTSH